MIEDNEETIPLSLTTYNTQPDNQIEKYFDLKNNISTIDRIGPFGNVSLHVATCRRPNEIVQLVLTNSALQSLENISSESSSNDELKKLYEKSSKLFDSNTEREDYDYIEWSLTGDDLIKKRQEFRAQIDLYKTYDNQHHLITKLLVEIIEYYLNEYLIQEENFSKEQAKKLESIFKKAIEEKNYLKYFIKAYTLTNNFHQVLNKHLALYILDYFDISNYSSFATKYRLINCLVHIVTLLINHPDIHKYQYQGIVYRGLLMTENDLKYYRIGNHILNRSFLSTSKQRQIAQMFADKSQQTLTRISVLLKYTIKLNQTAIDIENISTIPDEKEVLILPFSVFEIKDRIENCPNMCSPMLIEIDLEESQNDKQIDNKIDKSKTSSQHQRKRNIFRSKYFWGGIGVCIILILVLIPIGSHIFNIGESSSSSLINHYSTWKQHGIIIAGGNQQGNQSNQLSSPNGIYVDDDNQSIYIADWWNHRIAKWKYGAKNGEVVAGGNGKGNRMDQLNLPTDVIIDRKNNSLIICDQGNKRVIRRSLQYNQNQEIIISDIYCYGLAMDNNGDLYVSECGKNEVRQWKIGYNEGTIVAGGNGKGNNLNQLNYPTFIFVDQDYSVYVSDYLNHRVMKWMRDAKEGIVVAGGQGLGNSLTQLSNPQGVIVDHLGNVYVADSYNHRIMCWLKGSKEGTIIVGGNGKGEQSNQFNYPLGLSFDREGNLYVVDDGNHRVEKFVLN